MYICNSKNYRCDPVAVNLYTDWKWVVLQTSKNKGRDCRQFVLADLFFVIWFVAEPLTSSCCILCMLKKLQDGMSNSLTDLHYCFEVIEQYYEVGETWRDELSVILYMAVLEAVACKIRHIGFSSYYCSLYFWANMHKIYLPWNQTVMQHLYRAFKMSEEGKDTLWTACYIWM